MRTWYISYPADGTLKMFEAGTIEANLREGKVSLSDGSCETMSDSLDSIGIEKAGALYLYVTKDSKLQFDKAGWILVRGNSSFFLNHGAFNFFRIKFNEETTGYFIAFINADTFLQH